MSGIQWFALGVVLGGLVGFGIAAILAMAGRDSAVEEAVTMERARSDAEKTASFALGRELGMGEGRNAAEREARSKRSHAGVKAWRTRLGYEDPEPDLSNAAPHTEPRNA